MTDSVTHGRRDCTRIRMLVTQNHAEERGFASAISAHKAYTLSWIHRKADAVEEQLFSEGFSDVCDLEHS